MKKAIISGATGVLGTALVKKLADQGVDVLVLCNPGSKRNDLIPQSDRVKIVPCAMDEFTSLECDESDYDVFYHLAWEGTSGDARNDVFLQSRNVRNTLDAVKAAKRFGCRKFIGAGSQAEYGPTDVVLRPDTPVNPRTGYGIGKLSAGLMSGLLCSQLEMTRIWVRIASLYGPHDNPGSLVMSAIDKLKKREYFGATKCEQIWDYLYSEDAANAFFLLGNAKTTDKTYVLGNGTARRLRDYVEDIRNVVDPDGKIEFGALQYPPFQPMRLETDISEIVRDTGWRPKLEFSDGIRKVLSKL